MFINVGTINFASAQTMGTDPFAGVITWKASLDKTGQLRNGDVVTLSLEATIQKGYHLFSSIPPKKDANLPTIIELAPQFIGLKLEGKLMEEGKIIKKNDEIFETEIAYFQDKVIFKQKFKVNAEKCLMAGFLKYQVCDEESKCVAQTYPFEFKIIAP